MQSDHGPIWSQDRSDDGTGSFASTLATFLAQLAYLTIMVAVIFSSVTLLQALKIFVGFMLVGLVIQMSVAVALQMELKNDMQKSLPLDVESTNADES